MIDKLLEHLKDEKGLFKAARLKEAYIAKSYPAEYQIIIVYTQHLENIFFSERLWLYIENRTEKPVCEVCTGPLKWMSFGQGGYFKTCSNVCKVKHPDYQSNYQAAIMQKYGVTNVSQLKNVQQTIKDNNFKKYGVSNTSQLDDVKNKTVNTNQEKYGGIAPISSLEVKDKIKITNQEKYGVDCPFSSEEVKDKIKATNQERYCVENVQHNIDIKNKTMSTFNKNQLIKYREKYVDFDILNLCDNELEIKGDCGHIYNIPASIFRQRVVYYNIQNPCIECYPISAQQSILEKELQNFILSLGINIIANDRSFGLEFDIYIPEHNLAIEFNGLYWHNELYKKKNYHLDKKKQAESQGIRLVHVWEDDWLFKRDIIESRIKNLLRINVTKYMARKCQLLEVDKKVAKEFFLQNHLQGHVNFKKCYGLYFAGVLVSAMTFGHRRVAMGQKSVEGEFELLRFSNLLNVSVTGAANRLWQHFLKTDQPKKVITYADRCWSEMYHNVYEQMHFKYIGVTVPNYFYVIDMHRKHRFNFRKDKLVKEGHDPMMTEIQIMHSQGYYRIWDCGHLKFEYNQ